ALAGDTDFEDAPRPDRGREVEGGLLAVFELGRRFDGRDTENETDQDGQVTRHGCSSRACAIRQPSRGRKPTYLNSCEFSGLGGPSAEFSRIPLPQILAR